MAIIQWLGRRLTVITLVATAECARSVAYANMAVFDASGYAATIKIFNEELKQLTVLTDQYNTAVQYYQTVGTAADFLQGYIQNPQRLVQELGQCVVGPPRMRAPVSLPTVCQAFDYVQTQYFLPVNQPVSAQSADTIRERRKTLSVDALTRGLSFAEQELQRQERVGQDIAGLGLLTQQPSTQIGVQNVTNKILAAMLAEQARTNALLAALVQMQAGTQLEQKPLIFSGSGGTASGGGGSGGGGFGGGS